MAPTAGNQPLIGVIGVRLKKIAPLECAPRQRQRDVNQKRQGKRERQKRGANAVHAVAKVVDGHQAKQSPGA